MLHAFSLGRVKRVRLTGKRKRRQPQRSVRYEHSRPLLTLRLRRTPTDFWERAILCDIHAEHPSQERSEAHRYSYRQCSLEWDSEAAEEEAKDT